MNLYIRKKAYTFMDRYDVLDDTGRLVYMLDGKITVFGGKMTLRDHEGVELYELRKNVDPFFGNYKVIDLSDGAEAAVIRQQFHIHPRFRMTAGEQTYTVRGNLKACDYDIYNTGSSYALLRKRTLRWGNTYVLSLQDYNYAPLFTSLVVGIDAAVFHHS